MRNIFFGLSLLISCSVFAQFKVEGTIAGYTNQPITVKVYEGSMTKVISRPTTDTTGKFSTNIPNKYNGIFMLSLANGQEIKLLTDNQDILFTAKNQVPLQLTVQAEKGEVAKNYIKYNSINGLVDLKDNVFTQIINYYQPSDEFYLAIEKENARIERLAAQNNSINPMLSYYKKITDLLDEVSSTKGTTRDNVDKIINHLTSDDEKLEQMGFLTPLVFNYIKTEFNLQQANNQNAEEIIKKSTELLLTKIGLSNIRGQNVMAALLSFLSEQQFPTYYPELVTKAKSIQPVVSTDLKNKLISINGLTIGSEVPNIIFGEEVKGKKSLFDIKAKKKLIVFWASWCPACQAEMPHLQEYYTNFRKEGGEIIAISLDGDQQAYQEAIKSYEWYNYSELLKWDSEIAKQYGVNATPTLFLVDKDNKLIKKVHNLKEIQ
ncbi:Thiol-disulfide oxidoreductase resA [Weeksella virosa]|uniref:TlpA disulfide reductase family protein n=1 Tax=Weeksella virosa TaxID=1014 RepID=UPI000E0373D8|nr:TlpA disulfide reductase family protein [Weeksella virosa]SUP54470.1 Thiol-disulfide oxidoreductase resA [Weeksella virosa]